MFEGRYFAVPLKPSSPSSSLSRLSGKFVDRLITGFRQDPLDDLLFQVGGELWIAEIFPSCGHRTRKVLHEVLDTAFATKTEEQVWPHDTPTQSRSPAHRGIRVRDAQHVLLHEGDNLAIESGLKTVRDMADHLFSHVNGSLSD
jgi:hypothetical protein